MSYLPPSTPSQPVLHTTTPGGITTITLNRPHLRNAIDSPTASLLYAAFQNFEADPTQKICILTGTGSTFCAGFDLHSLASANSSLPGPVQNGNLGPMGPSRMHLSKPLIAAIPGHAVAGGLELSLLADLRIAETSSVFGVFCRRWGVPLIDGGTVRLQQIVGLGRALDMILTGRGVDAQEALQMGLANRVVPTGKSVEAAMIIAEELLAFPQDCMNRDRANCYYSAYEAKGVEDAMLREFQEGVKVIEKESREGAKQFAGGQGRHGIFAKAKL